MEKKVLLITVSALLCMFTTLYGRTQSGSDILRRIDENLASQNRKVESKMIIHGRRASRTVESVSWMQGTEKSFTEYLSPARERGTKMLKLGDNLWLYNPSTDRTIQISGHMLRQSVMGSDLSYEDMMEDMRLAPNYDAVVTGEDTIDSRPCRILDLTAKRDGLAYHFRRLWVDKERDIPLKEELIAKSGTLLKRIELYDAERMNDRWFPTRMIFKDMLGEGRGTEFIVEKIQFDIDIPDYIFSKAALKR